MWMMTLNRLMIKQYGNAIYISGNESKFSRCKKFALILYYHNLVLPGSHD